MQYAQGTDKVRDVSHKEASIDSQDKAREQK